MNRTVERTFQILQLIANANHGITLQEISDQLEIAKSSAFMIVHSLLELNYIRTVKNNDKKYRLGVETFSLGMKYTNDSGLVQQAANYLPALAEKYHKTAFVGVLNGTRVVYIYKYVSPSARLATCALGSSKDAYATALGKTILAFLPDNQLNSVIDQIKFVSYTEHTISGKDELLEQLRTIRSRGYAVESRELDYITACCSVPIFDYTGKVVAAISLSDLYREDELDINMINEMQAAAQKISAELGFNSFS